MELTDAQKEAVAQWVREGLGLADIQRKLSEEFRLTMTYMDVRFLVLDLGLEVHDLISRKGGAVKIGEERTLESEPEPTEWDEEAPSGAAVRVEVDRVMKPGAMISGTVVFSDGVSAAWALDQFGRLAIEAGRPGYSPSSQDIQVFQSELRQTLARHGF